MSIRVLIAIGLLLVALWLSLVPLHAQQPRFHVLPLARVATTTHTHVCTTARVVYVRRQQDGDWHLTLAEGTVTVVAEIIPALPLPVPNRGERITVCGITRVDRAHRWAEIHPVLELRSP